MFHLTDDTESDDIEARCIVRSLREMRVIRLGESPLTVAAPAAFAAVPVPDVAGGPSAAYAETLADVALPDGWTWADSAESVGNAGTNTFRATLTPEDTENYNTASDIEVTVEVGKAAATLTTPPTAETLTYNGAEQALVNAGAADGGTMQYAAGANGATAPELGFTEAIPTGKDAGNYTVFYYILGDKNHLDSGSASTPLGSVSVAITPPENLGINGRVLQSDGTTGIGGAAVRLMRGGAQIAAALTAPDGFYQLAAEAGIYNIVAEWDDGGASLTKTELVTVTEATEKDVVMPSGAANSVLEVKPDTPSVVVSGLDAEAESVLTESGGSSVTVTMEVESRPAESAQNAEELRALAAPQQELEFLEIQVKKTVDSVTTSIEQTVAVLEIVIPYAFKGKEFVTVYRSHDGSAAVLEERGGDADGTYRLDREAGFIYLYANRFSTYAIGYTQCYNIAGTIHYSDYSREITLSLLEKNGEKLTAYQSVSLADGTGAYSFTHIPKSGCNRFADMKDGEKRT